MGKAFRNGSRLESITHYLKDKLLIKLRFSLSWLTALRLKDWTSLSKNHISGAWKILHYDKSAFACLSKFLSLTKAYEIHKYINLHQILIISYKFLGYNNFLLYPWYYGNFCFQLLKNVFLISPTSKFS